MIVEKHHVEGYENFLDFMKKFESNETVFVFYIGTKLPNGYSWCPDCVDAKPFVEDWFGRVKRPVHFVEVEVGDKPFWKDLNCPFRTDPVTKLTVLPTLAKWNTQERLEGEECRTIDSLEAFLTEGDDKYDGKCDDGESGS